MDIRMYAFCLPLAAAALHAQQKHSATAPALPPIPPTVAPAVYVPPAPPPVKRASVVLDRGQLTVEAENSSLNQILRDVSRQTGMKLTGGVADERVFGVYGPARPADVVALLLKGTSSNMLYLDATKEKPAELVLTPRSGSATPPNAFTATRNEDDDQDNFTRPRPGQPVNNVNFDTANPNPDQPSQAEPATPAAAPTQDQQNGVKTPEQILQELLNLRGQSPNK